MQRWLKDGWAESDCTDLMAQNDEAARGAIEALQEAGFQVPEQVSVTDSMAYILDRVLRHQ